VILHLVAADEWARGASEELYVAPSLATEGFIHCTGDPQTLLAVANALYRDAEGEMVVLEVDETLLASEVRWEAAAPAPPPGVAADVRFPHVYGPIERAAVVRVRPLRRDPTGAFAD
jgi:uncharacterized protein (DUF952 family)